MTDWTSLDYVVVDVEGNGGRPPDLVELAVVPIADGHILEPASWLVRPASPITDIARRIHGITGEMVAGAPAFDAIEKEVRTVLDGAVIVAHNTPVGLGVLRRKLPRWEPTEVFDTLRLARRLRPERVSYRLRSLVEAFGLAAGLPIGHTPHRATYDALVTARLFVQLATHPGSPKTMVESAFRSTRRFPLHSALVPPRRYRPDRHVRQPAPTDVVSEQKCCYSGPLGPTRRPRWRPTRPGRGAAGDVPARRHHHNVVHVADRPGGRAAHHYHHAEHVWAPGNP